MDKGYHAGVSEFMYSKIKKNNGIIINLDEEGAVDFSDNSTLKQRYSKKLLKGALEAEQTKHQFGTICLLLFCFLGYSRAPKTHT